MDSSTTSSVAPPRCVLLAIDWTDGSPLVRLRDVEATESRPVPLTEMRLGYRATPESWRHCVGHTPFRRAQAAYVDCTNPPQPGSRTCERCSIVDATFASNLHHAHTRGRAELDPSILEHLQQPNELYLAAFRDGSIKVGTSTAGRRQKRLSEQGAWQAMIVADAADGFAVRDVEDRVTAELGLPQSVSMARKLGGMAAPRPDAAIAAELDRYAALVHSLLARTADSRLEPATERWRAPGFGDAVWAAVHRYPIKLESGHHDLDVVGACGRIMAVRRPESGDTFVADLGRLFGVELELGDFGSDELAVQDSLF